MLLIGGGRDLSTDFTDFGALREFLMGRVRPSQTAGFNGRGEIRTGMGEVVRWQYERDETAMGFWNSSSTLCRAAGGEVDVDAGAGGGGEVEAVGVGEFLEIRPPYCVAGVFSADDDGGDEDVGFVDEICGEEGGHHFGAAFDEDVGVVAGGEEFEKGGDLEAGVAVGGDGDGHGAARFEGAAAFFGDGGQFFCVDEHEGCEGDGAD